MTAEHLLALLTSLKVVQSGSSCVGCCPLCQPTEENTDKFHLRVNVGDTQPVLLFCVKCSIAKPVTNDERQHNWAVVSEILKSAAFDKSLLRATFTRQQIDALWDAMPVTCRDVGTCNVASDAILHECYHDHLLAKLALSRQHASWLAKRGMDAGWCFENGYRTAPDAKRAAELSSRLRFRDGVPGLTDDRWLTRDGALLIPCRNQSGQVVRVKMRLTDGGKARMRVLGGGSTKATPVLHWPLGSRLDATQPLWICEGERKADCVFYHYACPTVGVPGTGVWAAAASAAQKSSLVILAMDRDDAGRRATAQLGRAIAQHATVQVAVWSDGKGIDDAIQKHAKIELVEWDESKWPVLAAKPQREPLPTQNVPRVGDTLHDHQIVPYIAKYGPILRSQIKCFPTALSGLIRDGKIKMQKTPEGQLLEVPDELGDTG